MNLSNYDIFLEVDFSIDTYNTESIALEMLLPVVTMILARRPPSDPFVNCSLYVVEKGLKEVDARRCNLQ